MAVKGSVQSDLNKNIEDMLSNKKMRHFVRWYCDGQDKSKWDTLSKNYFGDIEMEKALDLYLEKEDVQKAINYVTKSQKDINLIKLYNAMLEKGLKGDVNSANWIIKFSESDFFNNKKDAVNEMIGGLNLNDE